MDARLRLRNHLLPEERSDRVIGKLRHPSIFKLNIFIHHQIATCAYYPF